jgi:RimJ/RimL family protein N-acetyltransferase
MDLRNVIIETERLRLVPLSEKYASEIFQEFTEEITTYMSPRSPENREETVEYIASMIPKIKDGEDFPVVILDKKTGEFLGCAGVHVLQGGTPGLGIWIKQSAHGNGYGREAVHGLKQWVDEHIPYNYLVYAADRHNTASRKIAESLGGTITAEYLRKSQSGKTLDLVEYRIYKK